MTSPAAPGSRPLTIGLGAGGSVSALWLAPPKAVACYVFAHGAGAGMTHASMTSFAEGLAAREVATLRFQFRYMERGSKRVDPPAVAQAAVRAAVDEAARLAGALPLFAGGRSFGGRMTSQAQAAAPLPGVRGLAFVGFPLHPAGKPGTDRATHLSEIEIPMLFLQGTRDELATLDLLNPTVHALGPNATLELFDDADHSFHVRTRSGHTDAQVREGMLDATVAWMATVIAQEERGA